MVYAFAADVAGADAEEVSAVVLVSDEAPEGAALVEAEALPDAPDLSAYFAVDGFSWVAAGSGAFSATSEAGLRSLRK